MILLWPSTKCFGKKNLKNVDIQINFDLFLKLSNSDFVVAVNKVSTLLVNLHVSKWNFKFVRLFGGKIQRFRVKHNFECGFEIKSPELPKVLLNPFSWKHSPSAVTSTKSPRNNNNTTGESERARATRRNHREKVSRATGRARMQPNRRDAHIKGPRARTSAAAGKPTLRSSFPVSAAATGKSALRWARAGGGRTVVVDASVVALVAGSTVRPAARARARTGVCS